MLKSVAAWFAFGSSIPLLVGASGMAPVPTDFWWVPYAAPIVGGALTAAVKIVSGVITARQRARADFNAERAKQLEADSDPAKQEQGRALELQARLERAEADAIAAVATKAESTVVTATTKGE